MTRPDYAAIRARLEAARKRVTDMCSGSGKWRMSIPVQQDDHDIAITASLDDVATLLDRCEALERENAELKAAPVTETGIATMPAPRCCFCGATASVFYKGEAACAEHCGKLDDAAPDEGRATS